MATKEEYAILSLYVYSVINQDENRPNLPAGWAQLELQPDNGYGFA